MSKIAMFVIATFSLCALVGAEPATNPQDSKDAQIKALQAKVHQQEAIIRDLSEKLAQAQVKQPLTLKFLPPQTMQSLPLVAPEPMPKGWVRREFNGTAFYLIPLGDK
ncbi:MAG TPA: hypothetical protein VFW23_11250 [Tepidisphaeraceae bacterium]|nr:hypothetical protein [Tepidisphaeraceae bacterium]